MPFPCSGSAQRAAATTLLVFCTLASACKSEEPAATTEGAPVKASVAAPPVNATNPCAVPSASAAHVAQVLGTGPLGGPKHYPDLPTQRCSYQGDGEITIEVTLQATRRDLDSARRQMEASLGGTASDVPGFGDAAFSHVATIDLGKEKLVVNSLGVQSGKIVIFTSSKAPMEKIRALETDLLRDLGAH
jgi:hypothetical protein